MTTLEDLRPKGTPRVYDLLKEAGIDVTDWGVTKDRGVVKNPAANRAKSGKWSFVDHQKGIAALCVWFDDLVQENPSGPIYCKPAPGAYATRINNNKVTFTTRQARDHALHEAESMFANIAEANKNQWPIRLIIGDGPRRDTDNPDTGPSKVKFRLLDNEAWSIKSFDLPSGDAILVRGAIPKFVDQHALRQPAAPQKRDVTGTAWNRDPAVRSEALKRAAGQCEYCEIRGFEMADGRIYLETHHVIPLSEGGPDHITNVAAICPNHHREAHHGKQRDSIRDKLLTKLKAAKR